MNSSPTLVPGSALDPGASCTHSPPRQHPQPCRACKNWLHTEVEASTILECCHSPRASAIPSPSRGSHPHDHHPLRQGDKVEARYKGKGTRYYPGTIATMREGAEGSSVLFRLLYDDGDKEEGALGINLRRVARPSSWSQHQ